jgi:initiation factor 1A
MANKQGGKNYKKAKSKTSNEGKETPLADPDDAQMYGRIMKINGNGYFTVFCNDNHERICHIRGAMRKRVWVEPGDVVLISIRDFDNQTVTPDITNNIKDPAPFWQLATKETTEKKSPKYKGDERGDIIYKYERKDESYIKKVDVKANPIIFKEIDKMDEAKLNIIKFAVPGDEKANQIYEEMAQDDGFEFDRGDNSEEEEDGDGRPRRKKGNQHIDKRLIEMKDAELNNINIDDI